MKLTYLGHSALLLETSTHRLLMDPFLTGNPKAAVDAGEIVADFVLLTHGHEDHLGDTVDIAKRTGATVIANWELAHYVKSMGVENIVPMNLGGRFQAAFGTVKLTPAVHSSSVTGPDGRSLFLGNPGGFLLHVDDKVIYNVGDSALTYDFKLIGERHRVDLAIVPIGDFFTMGIEDALTAVDFIQPKQVVPVHYDTFPPIEVDAAEFARRSSAPVKVLAPGEALDL